MPIRLLLKPFTPIHFVLSDASEKHVSPPDSDPIATSINPYAATEIPLGVDQNDETGTIRRQYLGHEASCKSIGLLYFQGQRVFSEDYKRIVQQTPHIVYRTSKLVKVLLGI